MKRFNTVAFKKTLLTLFLVLVIIALLVILNVITTNHKKQISHFRTEISDITSNYDEMVLMLIDRNTQLVDENDRLNSVVENKNCMFTEEEIYLLAQCVEAEAGDYQSHSRSQQYVTKVILNRVHSDKFPNSIREVIYESREGVPQFSVAYDGAIDREVSKETLYNVYKVLMHGTDLPEYVCYFYSTSVTDNWVNSLPIFNSVEGTVFAYSEEDYNEQQS